MTGEEDDTGESEARFARLAEELARLRVRRDVRAVERSFEKAARRVIPCSLPTRLTQADVNAAFNRLCESLRKDEVLSSEWRRFDLPRPNEDWCGDEWLVVVVGLAGFLRAWIQHRARAERIASDARLLKALMAVHGELEARESKRYTTPVDRLLAELPKSRAPSLIQRAIWGDHLSRYGNPWDVRAMRSVGLREILQRYIAEAQSSSQGGSDYVAWPLAFQTPTGQAPRNVGAAASWWAIRTLGLDRAPRSQRLDSLAAKVAARLVRAWSELTGEPGPELEGMDGRGEETFKGLNAKTIGQMVRELKRAQSADDRPFADGARDGEPAPD